MHPVHGAFFNFKFQIYEKISHNFELKFIERVPGTRSGQCGGIFFEILKNE